MLALGQLLTSVLTWAVSPKNPSGQGGGLLSPRKRGIISLNIGSANNWKVARSLSARVV